MKTSGFGLISRLSSWNKNKRNKQNFDTREKQNSNDHISTKWQLKFTHLLDILTLFAQSHSCPDARGPACQSTLLCHGHPEQKQLHKLAFRYTGNRDLSNFSENDEIQELTTMVIRLLDVPSKLSSISRAINLVSFGECCGNIIHSRPVGFYMSPLDIFRLAETREGGFSTTYVGRHRATQGQEWDQQNSHLIAHPWVHIYHHSD